MIQVGVMGYGQWGSNYVRILHELNGCSVVVVCDIRQERLQALKRRFPGVSVERNWEHILKNPPDAVIIATPASTHYTLAKKFLESGSHLLVEKPLATDSSEARELVRLAEKKKRVLMVGHVFEYHPAIQKMKEEIQRGTLGRLFYLVSIRANLGPIRPDVNAAWDLAPHDVSIFSYLTGLQPISVAAQGGDYLKRGRPDIAFITLRYSNGLLASIHVSWLAPQKRREITVVGSKKMLIFNDMKPEEQLRIYNKRVIRDYQTFGEFKLLCQEGDIRVPKISTIEPLKNLCFHFLEGVRTGKKLLASGEDGLQVVAMMEAIQRSMEEKGTPIPIRKM